MQILIINIRRKILKFQKRNLQTKIFNFFNLLFCNNDIMIKSLKHNIMQNNIMENSMKLLNYKFDYTSKYFFRIISIFIILFLTDSYMKF